MGNQSSSPVATQIICREFPQYFCPIPVGSFPSGSKIKFEENTFDYLSGDEMYTTKHESEAKLAATPIFKLGGKANNKSATFIKYIMLYDKYKQDPQSADPNDPTYVWACGVYLRITVHCLDMNANVDLDFKSAVDLQYMMKHKYVSTSFKVSTFGINARKILAEPEFKELAKLCVEVDADGTNIGDLFKSANVAFSAAQTNIFDHITQPDPIAMVIPPKIST